MSVSISAESLQAVLNRKAARLMQALALAPLNGGVVEVGCLRVPTEWPTDGWSTLYLAEGAKRDGRYFISFDTEQEAVDIANKVLAEHDLPESVVCLDGIEGIRAANQIALLYLDGSNDPAETLAQFEAARSRLLPGAIIVCDDVQMLDWDKLRGKATDLIPVLQAEGIEWDLYTTLPGYISLVARMPHSPLVA